MLYLCKCKNCAFLTIPTTDTDIAKMEMLNHRQTSHGEPFEFARKVPLNDLRELFTINTVRDAGEVAHYLAVKPWLRSTFWKAQRAIRQPPSFSGLSNGEFKLFLKSELRD